MLALGDLYLKGFIMVVWDPSVYKCKKKDLFNFFLSKTMKRVSLYGGNTFTSAQPTELKLISIYSFNQEINFPVHSNDIIK